MFELNTGILEEPRVTFDYSREHGCWSALVDQRASEQSLGRTLKHQNSSVLHYWLYVIYT